MVIGDCKKLSLDITVMQLTHAWRCTFLRTPVTVQATSLHTANANTIGMQTFWWTHKYCSIL